MNRFQLKLLACAAMLADHVCRGFFEDSYFAIAISQTIGRIAFPLFAFLLCRGVFHTRSRLRYAVQLLIAALVSEPVYDLFFYQKLFCWKDQNVIFTLLAALLMYCLLERFRQEILIQVLLVIAFGAGAQFACLNYGIFGIASCYIYYVTADRTYHFSCVFACLPLAAGFGSVGAFLAAVPLYFYDETRGRIPAAGKYAFYLFYPAHLGALLLIRFLTTGSL